METAMYLRVVIFGLFNFLIGHIDDPFKDTPSSWDKTVIQKEFVVVENDIKVADYFRYIDSLIANYQRNLEYELTEHLLVNHNPWIIDTLAGFDYYKRLERDTFIYDQREMTVLHRGDTLWIPDRSSVKLLQERFEHTLLDVNIPEFKLRIIEYGRVTHIFPVRVGRNAKRYLATAGRTVNLRTPIGEGEIVRIERNPWFVDPVSGRRYTTTLRDDGRRTTMPQIPWMEPMINGMRQGALIHPTSNPETLGKAYSNGCVGTAEGDAWYIYYHGPLGTKVRFRYDLKVVDTAQDTLFLKDVYGLSGKS